MAIFRQGLSRMTGNRQSGSERAGPQQWGPATRFQCNGDVSSQLTSDLVLRHQWCSQLGFECLFASTIVTRHRQLRAVYCCLE